MNKSSVNETLEEFADGLGLSSPYPDNIKELYRDERPTPGFKLALKASKKFK